MVKSSPPLLTENVFLYLRRKDRHRLFYSIYQLTNDFFTIVTFPYQIYKFLTGGLLH